MLIVGSKALSYYFPDVDVKDIDIIGTVENAMDLISTLNPKDVKQTEYLVTLLGIEKNEIFDKDNVEILLCDNSKSLSKYLEYDNANNHGVKCASLEVLYSLKRSHIHFPIKFHKHISDYCLLNQYFDGNDKLSDITKINYKETEIRRGKLRTPSLNKSVKEFFKQSNGFVKSFFIHDDIHIAVSHYDGHPLYERMQNDLDIAKCDRKLWEKFTFEDKCKCVLEEAYVISLERKILPILFGGGKYISSKDALNWALMRVCTTLCSGWFRQFATDNFLNIQEFINKNYVKDFLRKYQNGEIERCKELN